MGRISSKFVHAASWLAAILTGLMTVLWILIVANGNDWAAVFGFDMLAIGLGVGILGLGVAPGVELYLRTKQRGDLRSLRLTGCSFVILLVEIILMGIIGVGKD